MPNKLPRHLTTPDIAAFINRLAECRKDKSRWIVAHLKAMNGSAIGLAEMRQLLDHALQQTKAWVMILPATRELVVLADGMRLNIGQIIYGLVREHYESNSVRTLVVPLTDKGIQQLQPILAQMISESDQVSRIGLLRLARSGNVFVVLDDDPMMLKQMEHMLKAFGHVESCSVAGDFLDRYVTYAPNAVFVDIHLRAESGMEVTGALIGEVDPYAHVVMVSAGAVKDNILACKAKGAKGFLGKPVSREHVFRYVLAAPTFVSREL